MKKEILLINSELLTDELKASSQKVTKEFIESDFPKVADSIRESATKEEIRLAKTGQPIWNFEVREA